MTIQLIQHEKQIDNKIAVVKFGSSVLNDETGILQAVHEVYGYLREGFRVLVIVSALGETTNALLESIQKIVPDKNLEPDSHSTAELLATGETKSAALFSIALNGIGVPSYQLNHHYLKTKGFVLDSEPIQLRKSKILTLFKKYAVLVMPGFIGTSKEHFTTLLGRGGSDYSALFAAFALKAESCVLYKDTSGIFNKDPNDFSDALPYKTISYVDCLKLSYPVVQHKAIKFAEKNHFQFQVKSLAGRTWTTVGSKSELYKNKQETQIKKVILLGLGTVGLGVYQHLKSAPHLFEVVGVGVRHPDKYQGLVPNDLITDQIDALLKRDCDLVVELIGGLQDAEKYVVQSLLQKRHVITANKLLIAEKGEALQQLAHTNSVQLLYSAAVGGSIPILEQISHFVSSHPNDSIQSITGILNGTCNYILDEISKGKSFHEALINAQKAGFAEADPSFDISGKDTAHKLKIIARFAFGEDLKDFPIEGIYEEISKASAKLIAHCEKRSDGLHAWVLPQSISKDHPLSHVRGVDNGVVIQTRLGKTLQLKGKGAGGLPTAESVYADLLSIILETPLGIPKTFETPFSFKVAL